MQRSNDMSNADFEWMKPTARAHKAESTRAGWESELESRAALLCKLGYDKAAVEERLKRALVWEYELVGKAAAVKKVSAIVAEAYRGAGNVEKTASSRPSRRKSQ